MTTLDLLTERNTVLARLEKRWRWLDANPNRPQFAEREAACLADLADYERLEDAIRSAEPVQTGFLPASVDRFAS
jgi:hypothetical protein